MAQYKSDIVGMERVLDVILHVDPSSIAHHRKLQQLVSLFGGDPNVRRAPLPLEELPLAAPKLTKIQGLEPGPPPTGTSVRLVLVRQPEEHWRPNDSRKASQPSRRYKYVCMHSRTASQYRAL